MAKIKREEKTIEEMLKDDGFAEKVLLIELADLKEKAERDVNHAYLTKELLFSINSYFSLKSYKEQNSQVFQIYEILSSLVNLANNKTLKSTVETHDKTMAVGQFIQVLIDKGLSRNAAIRATAEWLDKGQSTVRESHEKFRNLHEGTYRCFISFSYSQNILQEVKPQLSREQNIVKSKKALQALFDFYNMRDETINRMFCEFKEIDNKAE